MPHLGYVAPLLCMVLQDITLNISIWRFVILLAPPIPPISGLTKKRRYSEIDGITIGSHNSYITYKTLIWDLEMGGGIGGRWYWEGRYWGDDCRIKN